MSVSITKLNLSKQTFFSSVCVLCFIGVIGPTVFAVCHYVL